jgi:hypothetical protein
MLDGTSLVVFDSFSSAGHGSSGKMGIPLALGDPEIIGSEAAQDDIREGFTR